MSFKDNRARNLLLPSRNQGVAETESGARKFVQNRRIDFVVVIAAETFLKWQQAELLHLRSANKSWKKFVVDDVMPLTN